MMDLVEMGKTFQAFFVPLYTFDTKQVLYCKNCQWTTTISNYEALKANYGDFGRLRSNPRIGGGGSTTDVQQQKQQQQQQQQSCRQCGASIRGDWRFCPNCGVDQVSDS